MTNVPDGRHRFFNGGQLDLQLGNQGSLLAVIEPIK